MPAYSNATPMTTAAAAALSSGTSTAALLLGSVVMGAEMVVIMVVLLDMTACSLVSAFMSVIATMTVAAAVSNPEFVQFSCTSRTFQLFFRSVFIASRASNNTKRCCKLSTRHRVPAPVTKRCCKHMAPVDAKEQRTPHVHSEALLEQKYVKLATGSHCADEGRAAIVDSVHRRGNVVKKHSINAKQC